MTSRQHPPPPPTTPRVAARLRLALPRQGEEPRTPTGSTGQNRRARHGLYRRLRHYRRVAVVSLSSVAVLIIAAAVHGRSRADGNAAVGVVFLLLALVYGAAAGVRFCASRPRRRATTDDEERE